MSRCIKFTFILSCLFLLNSCTVKITYHFLDNLIGWELGQYVNLKGQQKKDAQQAIKEFHKWHQATQLALYADYLEQLKNRMLAGPVSAEYLHAESDKLQDLLDLSMRELMPSVANIASTLNDKQIQQVLKKMESDRKKYRDDYINASAKRIQKQRIRDITRYIGGFFGGFTEQQKQRMIDWEESLKPHEKLMIKQQKQWQLDFIDAMTYQNNLPELETRLQSLMMYRTDNWDAELQSQLDINQDLTFVMLADLFNSQTEKQKNKMERKFDTYINDLKDLSGASKQRLEAEQLSPADATIKE